MKLRLIAMLLAVPALVAGLLVISPAEAASPSVGLASKSIAMTTNNATTLVGAAELYCKNSKPCTGTIMFKGSPQYKRSYSISPRKYAMVRVYMDKTDPGNPSTNPPGSGQNASSGLYSYTDTKLIINEARPSNLGSYEQAVRTETKPPRGRIDYSVKSSLDGLKDVKIELVRSIRGGNTKVIAHEDLAIEPNGSFFIPLATNNEPGEAFKLRLSARDADGTLYSWYWRGTDNNPAGGGRYLSEGSSVRATKDVFHADIYFGTIRGSAPPNSTVRVAAIPATYSGSTLRRSLDIPSCANVFGEVKMDSASTYSVPFLPFDNSGSDKRYVVSATSGDDQVWMGNSTNKGGDERFGSCMDVLNYDWNDHSNFIAIPGSGTATRDISSNDISTIGKTVTIKTSMKGFSPTSSDRNVRLREKIPGLTVLESPLVAEGTTGTGAISSVTLNDVPPGKYIIEVGRRTGCSAWYPSRYPNNSAYLNGADRGAEAWKAFSTAYAIPLSLRKIAVEHGATRTQYSKPKGYAGWMYRGHCKAYGQGIYRNEVNVTDDTPTVTAGTNSNTKGAVVRGRVTRVGGKTNKEMMVRLSSSDGERVIRTDVTDGSGYFYVAGLPSGNWTISVNPDSWRGIGRSFSGKTSIRVSAGHTYNAGTLRFNS